MDELWKYVEGAYAENQSKRAEESVKEVAKKLELAERNALLMADLREFMLTVLPPELMPAVKLGDAEDVLQGYPRVSIEIEGCVPIVIEVRYFVKPDRFSLTDDTPFRVAGLEISSAGADGKDIYEGSARFTWSRGYAGRYQTTSIKDLRTALGLARERWLALAEAEAENKRQYDALVMHRQEKSARVEIDAEYVPLIEEVTPGMVFNQAFREYVYDLVDERWKFLAAAVNCYE